MVCIFILEKDYKKNYVQNQRLKIYGKSMKTILENIFF